MQAFELLPCDDANNVLETQAKFFVEFTTMHLHRILSLMCLLQGKLLAAPQRLPDVLNLFVTTLDTCHVTARHSRLRSLTLLAEVGCARLRSQSEPSLQDTQMVKHMMLKQEREVAWVEWVLCL